MGKKLGLVIAAIALLGAAAFAGFVGCGQARAESYDVTYFYLPG